MKTNIRILSVILVLLLSFSMVPFAVSAEDNAQESDQMYKDIVFDVLGDKLGSDDYYYRFEYAYNEDGSTLSISRGKFK